MFGKRDWMTMGLIGGAQIGLIMCYWGLSSANPPPRNTAFLHHQRQQFRPHEYPPPKKQTPADSPAPTMQKTPSRQVNKQDIIHAKFESPMMLTLPGESFNKPPSLPELPIQPIDKEISISPPMPPSEEPKKLTALPIPPPMPMPMPTIDPQKDDAKAIADIPIPPRPPALPPREAKPAPVTPIQSLPPKPGINASLPAPIEIDTAEVKKTKPVAKKLGPCPWQFKMEIVAGRTQLTATAKNGMQLQVRCDKLTMQRPTGGIEAIGNVEISGKDLQGKCDRLLVAWDEERIELNGNAHVSSRWTGEQMELKGEQLKLRLARN